MKVDIMYKNIKHLFFQPCEDELIVLIHFHLKSPIKIPGLEKVAKDFQVYREVIEAAQDTTRGRGDNEEIYLEEEERRRRDKFNKEFANFTKRVDDFLDQSEVTVNFDIPFRKMAFQGVAHRESVDLIPTENCLVHLINTPFEVLTLDEIEVAYFERVQMSLRNFDLVLVNKKYEDPAVKVDQCWKRISIIPMEKLDDVKAWLDMNNIKYYEGTIAVAWSKILNQVRSMGVDGFWDDGGWETIFGDDEEDPDDDGSGEETSEFECDDEDSDESDSYGEDSDEEESDNDSVFDESEEEEGLDWDELEEEAKKADHETKQKERETADSDDDRRRKDKKRSHDKKSDKSDKKRSKR
jgi:nucleosome binding factor SPN SPT16 subunit